MRGKSRACASRWPPSRASIPSKAIDAPGYTVTLLRGLEILGEQGPRVSLAAEPSLSAERGNCRAMLYGDFTAGTGDSRSEARRLAVLLDIIHRRAYGRPIACTRTEARLFPSPTENLWLRL